jgi:hypothetical protein
MRRPDRVARRESPRRESKAPSRTRRAPGWCRSPSSALRGDRADGEAGVSCCWADASDVATSERAALRRMTSSMARPDPLMRVITLPAPGQRVHPAHAMNAVVRGNRGRLTKVMAARLVIPGSLRDGVADPYYVPPARARRGDSGQVTQRESLRSRPEVAACSVLLCPASRSSQEPLSPSPPVRTAQARPPWTPRDPP